MLFSVLDNAIQCSCPAFSGVSISFANLPIVVLTLTPHVCMSCCLSVGPFHYQVQVGQSPFVSYPCESSLTFSKMHVLAISESKTTVYNHTIWATKSKCHQPSARIHLYILNNGVLGIKKCNGTPQCPILAQ